ncbi:ABC transporter I family member 20 [Sesamum angolense]|uniref:ABC transporter I family member 20 n=1 Tax=Sesamum angolense TaxID=2727404 RepID=A0AAE1WZL1_9LAMI|nr:ABC transporter I family member 20 [Sesamum angolense]
MAEEDRSRPTLEINRLKFTYPGIDGHPPPGSAPLIDDLSLTLFPGDRCLLVGSNGAGKTTILKIIGGKHMVEQDMVRVLGRSAFHDTALTASGDLSYLGGEWRREVAFAGFEIPIQMDVSAEKMIYGVAGIDPHRRDELIKVLLLDEITVDLDVLARADLLRFLKKECEERGLRGSWEVATSDANNKIKEISNLSLMRTVESWLRKERDEERKRRKERKASGLPEYEKRVEGSRVIGDPAGRVLNNGWAAGRLNSTVAGEENFVLSSNRVLR